jgi:hypothetical protein
MTTTPLHPLNPLLHAEYVAALTPVAGERDPLPPHLRATVAALVARRNVAPEAELDAIDREIVDAMYWYALRPDDIARRTLDHHGWSRRHPLMLEQATVILAAIGEAGYPITGNGAPDYDDSIQHSGRWQEWHPPVRGPERDRVLWAAARYWAEAASRHLTYVSLGDCRGFLPRPVQYDQPAGMHPQQQAALTLGPARDRGDECGSHDYMRRHTRLLLLIRGSRD